MKSKLTITCLLIVILSFGLVGQTLAQSRVPGVKGQDYLIYNITSHWSSDNASAAVPTGLLEINKTSQYQVRISGVSGANITTTELWDFVNGTEFPYLVGWNVESGESYYMQQKFEGIVGVNLGVGDLLHPAGNNSIMINRTITRSYAGGVRDTNVVELSNPIQNNETDNSTVGMSSATYYIDKATGVLVEQIIEANHTTNPAETESIVWTLKETNLWEASPPLALSLLIIIAIAVVVVVVVVLAVVYRTRRRGHKKKSRL